MALLRDIDRGVAGLNSNGCVMAVGGAEDKIDRRTLLSKFVELAGGSDASIVILPSASTIPLERGELYAAIFRELGAREVTILQLETRQQAGAARNARVVDEASGVFVTGGVQLRLISLLGGTSIADSIQRLVQRGGVYCGTSAGAAAVSSHMIVTGRAGMKVRRSMVDLAPGLGLVPQAIIDQHFSQRGRLGRLIAAVGANPQFLGIGIDEDTAALFHRDQSMEILGAGQVVVLDASRVRTTDLHAVARTKPFAMSPLQLHLLTEGSIFDLVSRKLRSRRKRQKSSQIA